MCPRLALRALFFIPLLTASAFASDLKIKVLDPQSARVAGARILLARTSDHYVVAIRNTDSRGEAAIGNLANGDYSLDVLAPGFALLRKTLSLPGETALELKLAVLAAPETVVVSATRTPILAEESGSIVETMDHDQIETLQPVAAGEALRFVPGTIVADSGQRGGLTSLFVRGGESRYNKVIVDGVPVNDPGGVFNFGVVPLAQTDRVELLRGTNSTLYGSDAMTSVVQFWSRTGSSLVPNLEFGADGGNFGSAHGYASLSGAWKRLDYNVFGDRFGTDGDGINTEYFNTLVGTNLGIAISRNATLRFRGRNSQSRTGVPGTWDFNGQKLLPPDADGRARQHDFNGSVQLDLLAPAQWQHKLTAYEYHHQRTNLDTADDRRCFVTNTSFLGADCYLDDRLDLNRAGFDYQGTWAPRTWSRSIFGYEFEDENGFLHDKFLTLDPVTFLPLVGASDNHGLRRNHALFGEQSLIYKRLSAVGGLRYVHNETFGDRAVPRVALTYLALRGGDLFSGTRLRFAFAKGIQEPTFDASFGSTGINPTRPNPDLRPEENRSIEGGLIQSFAGGKYSFVANYFHNVFKNQIAFQTIDPVTFQGEFFNVSRSRAHGVELEFHGRPRAGWSLDGGYFYTHSKILEAPPLCVFPTVLNCVFDQHFTTGQPLLRRPRHSGMLLITYAGPRWGGNFGGTFIGRRPDSDFGTLSFFGVVPPEPIDHTAGYARFDMGAWYAVHRRVTIYANGENIFDRHYEDVAGIPALGATIRAGVRFRVGGE
jgi:outer membrane cobalamin receptor